MPIVSENSPVTFQDNLPDKVDVTIIGGGVIGVCTAWFLARAGVSVLVCEKGRIAGEQSSRNWGWVRTQGRDEAEVPIAKESLRIWDELSDELGNELGYSREGILFLADTEKEMAEFEDWLSIAESNGLDTRLVSAGELGKKIGYDAHRWQGAMYTPSDARAEPFMAVPAIARAAQAKGVTIIENCAVRSVEKEAGAVNEVITELGPVRTNTVMLAGGAWSSTFLANLGIAFPQLLVKGTVVRTKPVGEGFSGAAGSHKFTFRRRQDGGYTVTLGNYLEHYVNTESFRYCMKFLPALSVTWTGLRLKLDNSLMDGLFPSRSWQADEETPFERTRVLNPAPNRSAVKKIESMMGQQLPLLDGAGIEEAWAGMIDAPPDFVPVMDELQGFKGFYIATGFSGHGFGIGPGAGKVMADMIQGKDIEFDLNRFRFPRFYDGSPIRVGPAL